MTGLCEGRVAIVTGGGRGIGREHCLLLAAHGAKVVVNDLGGSTDGRGGDVSAAARVVDEIRAAGGEAIADGADVSDWDQAAAMIDKAVTTFGKLDVLINNAGILRDRMLTNMAEDEWDTVIKVHLKGTFAPTRHAAAYWRNASKAASHPLNARVINTSSASGLYGNVGQTNYGAAKAGIASFTIVAARELDRYGVTVNAIAPAALTRMTEGLVQADSEESRELLSPRWIAPIAVWLASEQSGDVSGRVFEADGSLLGVAEGWRRGPTAAPTGDPTLLGPIVRGLLANARNNFGDDGQAS